VNDFVHLIAELQLQRVMVLAALAAFARRGGADFPPLEVSAALATLRGLTMTLYDEHEIAQVCAR